MKSSREDGRGHWPRGKHRNPDKGNWERVRLSLARFLDAYGAAGGPGAEVSVRALSRALGLSDRAVRRYIKGDPPNRPPVEIQDAIEQWLEERREEVKRRKK